MMKAIVNKLFQEGRWFVALASLAFLFIYYVVYLSSYLNTITVDIEFSADKPGLLTFYWPTPENGYVQSESQSFKYQAGLNHIRVDGKAYDEKLTLRIDPDSVANRIQITRMSLEKFNNVAHLDHLGLTDSIVGVNSLTWKHGDESLEMTLAKDDPQLLLGNLPFPSPGLMTGFVMVLALTSVLVIQIYLNHVLSRVSARKQGEILSAILFICLLVLVFDIINIQESNLAALMFSLLASTGIILLLWIVKPLLGSGNESGVAWSIMIAAPFVIFLMVLMFQTIKIEDFDSELAAAYESLLDQGSGTTGDKIKSARDALEETFVNDFILRTKLVSLNAESKIFVFGFSPTDKVIIGKDNWFFEGYGGRRVEKDIVRSFDNVTDYMGQNPLTEKELESWRIALEERYYWLKERGIDYIFALAPTKALIYPEKLPERLYQYKNRLNRPTRYDQLIGYLKKNSVVPVVDLRKVLLEAKNNEQDVPLFYRTDFHWNYHGAFLAYSAIVDAINDAYPEYDLDNGKVEEFTVKKKTDWVHNRFMYMVGLNPKRHQDETYFTFYPKPDSQYSDIYGFDKNGISDYSLPGMSRELFGKKEFTVRKIDNPNGKLDLMYIIGDSFIEKTLGFFSLHSKESMNFRVVTEFPLIPFSDPEKQPELVVQEVLNMYLLQPPPVNPPQVRKARTRALGSNAS